MILENLQAFVNEMQATSSSLDKITIIQKHKDVPGIQTILKYIYDPYKQYHVTSKTCKKNIGLFKYNAYETIFEL